jgi:phenylacetate-CoA ligase
MKKRKPVAVESPELYLETVMGNAQKDPRELREYQGELLKKLVHFAYEQVPFYRKKYDEAGVNPRDVSSIDDISRLPMVTKGDLKDLQAREIIPSGSSPCDFMLLRTAGSTGEPLTIYRDRESINRIRDYNMWIYYRWCNGNPYDNVLYIMTVSPTSLEKMLLELFPVESDRVMNVMLPTHVHFQYLQKYVPQYLSTYPSVIRNLSIELLRKKKKATFVKLIHSTAELLDDHTRLMAREAFPEARIVQSYGSHEGGLIAFQCPDHEYFHICNDSVFLEAVNVEAMVDSKTAVITDFTNFGTPIIRYAGMGDLVQLRNAPCSCGISYPLIDRLEGRIIDSIILPDGTGISPFTVTLILKELRGIHKFQVVQNELDSIEIRVVPQTKDLKEKKELETRIVSELRKTIARDLEFHVVYVLEISARKPGSHKVPVVICNLKTDEILTRKKKDEH